jgi:hypothetical protein
MVSRPSDGPASPDAVDIDANGVDRAQIRAMLDLTPEQRLQRVGEFVDSILEIRGLNEERPIR